MPVKGFNYANITKELVDATYRADPNLRPFYGGDRAVMFGKESAKDFAARKWAIEANAKQNPTKKRRSHNARNREWYKRTAIARRVGS